MGSRVRNLVRPTRGDRDVEGRAVSASFLKGRRVLILCDDGEMRVLSQIGMVDVWEELWNATAKGPALGGWERA